MEIKINIADILKDKPVGLKLYSNTFGYISFNGVHKDKVYFFSEDTNAHSVKPNGKMYDGGECIIFPSKEMRDWEKFSWKKGDILVSEDNVHIIFEKFEDDTYTRFKGKHYLWKECDEEDYNKEETKMLTSVFEKATDDDAQTYISTIEERLGGKLNRETLEIEKTYMVSKIEPWDEGMDTSHTYRYYGNIHLVLNKICKDGHPSRRNQDNYLLCSTDIEKFKLAEDGKTVRL